MPLFEIETNEQEYRIADHRIAYLQEVVGRGMQGMIELQPTYPMAEIVVIYEEAVKELESSNPPTT